jgi:hypothetical protein
VNVTLLQVVALCALALGAWFFWNSLKVREAANAAMRAACRSEGWFFLDDTVALESIWPVRDDDGRLTLRRTYDFEYSDTGHNRRKGSITMIGDRVSVVDVAARPTVNATLR